MVKYRCPVCGKPVLPSFKFCKSCGARLPKDLFERQRKTHRLHSTSMRQSDSNDKKEKPTKATFEPIDDSVVHALAVKGRLNIIDKEIEEILDEIENLHERVKVGLIPKKDAKERVNDLEKRFVEIKLEKKKLSKGGTEIPIFTLIKTKEEAKERLEKLEKLKHDKSISEKTYKKMKNEYQDEISDKERSISQEIVKMERWKEQLKDDLASKRETLETLFVRKSTGELDQDEYHEKQQDLTEEIKNYEAALEELKKLLEKIS
jgi:hypothetical protein